MRKLDKKAGLRKSLCVFTTCREHATFSTLFSLIAKLYEQRRKRRGYLRWETRVGEFSKNSLSRVGKFSLKFSHEGVKQYVLRDSKIYS